MCVALLNVLRVAQGRLRRLERITPVVLFATSFGAGGALAAAVHTKSVFLISAAALVLVGGVAGLALWLLIADRRASSPPRHIAWRDRQWTEFERGFWDYVERSSGTPPAPK